VGNSAAVTLKVGYLAAMCDLYLHRPALLAAVLVIGLIATLFVLHRPVRR
jgi:hypothetical protein